MNGTNELLIPNYNAPLSWITPRPPRFPPLFPFQRSVSEQSEVNNCVYIKQVLENSFKRVFFPKEIILTALLKAIFSEFPISLSLFSKNKIWIITLSNFTGVQTCCKNKIIPNFKKFPILLFSPLLLKRVANESRTRGEASRGFPLETVPWWTASGEGRSGNEGEPGCKQAPFVCSLASRATPLSRLSHAAIKL